SATSSTATTMPTGWFRTSFVHRQRTTIQLQAIERVDRLLTFRLVSHSDKGKPARTICLTVVDNCHLFNLAIRAELLLERLLGGVVRQIAYINLHREAPRPNQWP